jgi:hypothetical protein
MQNCKLPEKINSVGSLSRKEKVMRLLPSPQLVLLHQAEKLEISNEFSFKRVWLTKRWFEHECIQPSIYELFLDLIGQEGTNS